MTSKFDFLNNGMSLLITPAFALAWFLSDIYWATATLMFLLTLQVILLKIFGAPVQKMTWITLILVLVFGSLTLLLQDKIYLQMKTSIIYSIFAITLLVADFLLKKNLIQLALIKFFDPPQYIWRRISTFLAILFVLLAIANWFVFSFLSESAWVIIKTFVFPATLFLFCLLLGFHLFRYAKPESQ